MKRSVVICSVMLLLVSCAAEPVREDKSEGFFSTQWSTRTSPTTGAPQIHGSYTAGCLAGASRLEVKGKHYQIAHPGRRKYYGHPDLIDFIQKLSADISHKHNVTLLVSDVSQARGGPPGREGGHKSHQTGLDVDLWLNVKADKKDVSPHSMVLGNGRAVDPHYWGNIQKTLLQTAAGMDKVDRIFVNPAIKQHLCTLYKGEDWLAKIRPWWGHDRHFHVRLKCPKQSATCLPQEPLDLSNDGCDASLAWWFSEDAKAKLTEKPKPYMYPTLPPACRQVFYQ